MQNEKLRSPAAVGHEKDKLLTRKAEINARSHHLNGGQPQLLCSRGNSKSGSPDCFCCTATARRTKRDTERTCTIEAMAVEQGSKLPVPHSWSVYVCSSFSPASMADNGSRRSPTRCRVHMGMSAAGGYYNRYAQQRLGSHLGPSCRSSLPLPEEHSMTPTAKGSGCPSTRTAVSCPVLKCGRPAGGAITPARNRSAPPSTCQAAHSACMTTSNGDRCVCASAALVARSQPCMAVQCQLASAADSQDVARAPWG